MPTNNVVTSTEAYTKALLHCYKYPTQPVLGMLIGKRIGGGNGCYVADAVPLFHALPMTAPHPMLEVAYSHVQSLSKTRGLNLLGVYLANERISDHAVSALNAALLDAVAHRLPGGSKLLVWFVDNETLTSPPTGCSITSYFHKSLPAGGDVPRPDAVPADQQLAFGQWNSDTVSPEVTQSVEAAVMSVGEALEAFAPYRLVDLEDHLENPQVNYLEQPLEDLVKRAGTK
ncbi:hypothetical protein STCU_01435 [Strigomonas culicis]|uniref:MPN domain-containing protein n=1 Tax=Strigomonas culicis TaxID=28005 RepID=S9UUS0_9TRYP|nr:hypothetical protein STCU_01435 [Strigomonas culicis]|eukprot:EPY34667.1 hypothetical protein STCU_01435 [Strigomonas culicis]